MPDSLVKRTFFVSKQYTYQEGRSMVRRKYNPERNEEEEHGVIRVHDAHDTIRDRLETWLGENAIRGIIIGRSGVTCDLKGRTVYLEGNAKLEGDNEYTPYHHVFRVSSAPVVRELPPELVQLFREEGYERADKDSMIVGFAFSKETNEDLKKRGVGREQFQLNLKY